NFTNSHESTPTWLWGTSEICDNSVQFMSFSFFIRVIRGQIFRPRQGYDRQVRCGGSALGKPRSFSWASKKLRNLGGFQTRFPLYRTETHLCGSQRRASARFK